uniref:Uncharacterized protein n=1 Tax=Oryza brachyantha TaxID=4533 RepID=J3L7U3_ORYBR
PHLFILQIEQLKLIVNPINHHCSGAYLLLIIDGITFLLAPVPPFPFRDKRVFAVSVVRHFTCALL